MVKKLNNKGLSLVELVIAIAMSTIIIGAATVFLYQASRSYRTAEYTIDLQMEAQLLMEQMANWTMESNWVKVDGTTGNSVLFLYNIPRHKEQLNFVPEDSSAKTATRRIIYISGDKLYMKKDMDTPENYVNEIKYNTFDMAAFREEVPLPQNCIGDYVELFTVSLPTGVDASQISSIEVKLEMHEGITRQEQSYSVSNVFSLRNGQYEGIQ